MPRLLLPQVYAPRSAHLVLFEKEFEGLNSFYWLYRSSSALLLQQAQGFAKLTDFVPQPEASRLDLLCSDLAGVQQQADRVARYGILVQVITYYEGYLSSILTDLVASRWPANRQATIKFRPSELPAGNLEEYIKQKAIKAEIDGIIGDTYRKRVSRVANLLENCGFPKPAADASRDELVTAACEIRNCIVHSGGKVDQRAYDELVDTYSSITVGTQFELPEKDLWTLVGAVRDDARAIDFAMRKQASDRRVRKAAKRKRASARRKAENLRQKALRASGNVA